MVHHLKVKTKSMRQKLFFIAVIVSVLATSCTKSYIETEKGIQFQSPQGVVQVNVCSPEIIQVAFSDSVRSEKKSLVVNAEWDNTPFRIKENKQTIQVRTSVIHAEIDKQTGLVSFHSPDGQLILSEVQKKLTPHEAHGIQTNECVAVFNSTDDEALYGLGQHQQSIMNYKGKSQHLGQSNMEIALPVLVSTKGYGLLWDNYSESEFDGTIDGGSKYAFKSRCGMKVDYYFMYGPTPDKIITQYRKETGKAPMFPKWAYGLFQSMDRYDTANELIEVSQNYRKNNIPLDVIVQDWQYWAPYAWGSHKMNEEKYPDPKKLIDSLHALNIHTMISVWPLFTEGDEHYKAMEDLSALYPSNGIHHYYDPHNAEARKVYWQQVKNNLFGTYGWDAWWCDGNEPDNWPDSYDRNEAVTAMGKGVQMYNTFPLMHTQAVSDGWRKDIEGKRLFTLSRSAFLGQQRYSAASWSGDIKSNWEDYKKQLSAGLNFCLSGIPYWTTDIGGYWGTEFSEPDNQELFTRWFQYGAFTPIFRIHGKKERMIYSDTWSNETRNILIKYDKLRYHLMPYIYSLAWKITNEDYTIMRHLVMDFPNDNKVYNIADQFMFGPALMINPVTEKGQNHRKLYLPKGLWYNFWTGEATQGNQTISTDAPIETLPIFVKAGSIIPMAGKIQYANEKSDITLRIYPGANGQFELYEDEGDSYRYEENEYITILFEYDDEAQSLKIAKRKGEFAGMDRKRNFNIVLVNSSNGTGDQDLPVRFLQVKYLGEEMDIDLKELN